jgi:hypothetical protein
MGSPQDFVNKYYGYAKRVEERYGIPANYLLSMAANEIGWDEQMIPGSNNLFGIKGTGPAGSMSSGTWEEYDGERVDIVDSFAAYNNPEESFEDVAKNILSDRYKHVLSAQNPYDFAAGMQQAGWATDSQYANKIASIYDMISGLNPDSLATPLSGFGGGYTTPLEGGLASGAQAAQTLGQPSFQRFFQPINPESAKYLKIGKYLDKSLEGLGTSQEAKMFFEANEAGPQDNPEEPLLPEVPTIIGAGADDYWNQMLEQQVLDRVEGELGTNYKEVLGKVRKKSRELAPQMSLVNRELQAIANRALPSAIEERTKIQSEKLQPKSWQEAAQLQMAYVNPYGPVPYTAAQESGATGAGAAEALKLSEQGYKTPEIQAEIQKIYQKYEPVVKELDRNRFVEAYALGAVGAWQNGLWENPTQSIQQFINQAAANTDDPGKFREYISGILTDEDKKAMLDIFNSVSTLPRIGPEETASLEGIADILSKKPEGRPVLMSQLTSQEIINGMRGVHGPPDLGGLSPEQVRTYIAKMSDLSPEDQKKLLDAESYYREIAQQYAIQTKAMMDFKNGLQNPKLLDVTGWDYVKMAIAAPALLTLEAMEFYSDNVSKPLAAQAVLNKSATFTSAGMLAAMGYGAGGSVGAGIGGTIGAGVGSYTQLSLEGELTREYKKIKSQHPEWSEREILLWAWDNVDENGLAKFLAEAINDPINLLGAGAVSRAMTKFPAAGKWLGLADRSFLTFMDRATPHLISGTVGGLVAGPVGFGAGVVAPFVYKAVPKTLAQTAATRSGNGVQLLYTLARTAAQEKGASVARSFMPEMESFRSVVTAAINEIKTNPSGRNFTKLGQLGEYLWQSGLKPLAARDLISIYGRMRIKKELADITDMDMYKVMEAIFTHRGSEAEARVAAVAAALGVTGLEKKVGRVGFTKAQVLATWLDEIDEAAYKRSAKYFLDKEAKDPTQAMKSFFDHGKNTFLEHSRNPALKYARADGVNGSIQLFADRLARAGFQVGNKRREPLMMLDNITHSFARHNLMFASFGLFNVIESTYKMMGGGVSPFGMMVAEGKGWTNRFVPHAINTPMMFLQFFGDLPNYPVRYLMPNVYSSGALMRADIVDAVTTALSRRKQGPGGWLPGYNKDIPLAEWIGSGMQKIAPTSRAAKWFEDNQPHLPLSLSSLNNLTDKVQYLQQAWYLMMRALSNMKALDSRFAVVVDGVIRDIHATRLPELLGNGSVNAIKTKLSLAMTTGDAAYVRKLGMNLADLSSMRLATDVTNFLEKFPHLGSEFTTRVVDDVVSGVAHLGNLPQYMTNLRATWLDKSVIGKLDLHAAMFDRVQNQLLDLVPGNFDEVADLLSQSVQLAGHSERAAHEALQITALRGRDLKPEARKKLYSYTLEQLERLRTKIDGALQLSMDKVMDMVQGQGNPTVNWSRVRWGPGLTGTKGVYQIDRSLVNETTQGMFDTVNALLKSNKSVIDKGIKLPTKPLTPEQMEALQWAELVTGGQISIQGDVVKLMPYKEFNRALSIQTGAGLVPRVQKLFDALPVNERLTVRKVSIAKANKTQLLDGQSILEKRKVDCVIVPKKNKAGKIVGTEVIFRDATAAMDEDALYEAVGTYLVRQAQETADFETIQTLMRGMVDRQARQMGGKTTKGAKLNMERIYRELDEQIAEFMKWVANDKGMVYHDDVVATRNKLVDEFKRYVKGSELIDDPRLMEGFTFEGGSAVLDIEDKIRRSTDSEHVYVIDDNGNILYNQTGEKDRVAIDWDDMDKAKDVVITHSHPYVASFSPSDVFMAVRTDARQIRAVDNRFTYVINRPKNGWSDDLYGSLQRVWDRLYGEVEDEETKFIRSFDKVWDTLDPEAKKLARGKADALIADRTHIVMEKFSKHFGLDYKRIPVGSKATKVEADEVTRAFAQVYPKSAPGMNLADKQKELIMRWYDLNMKSVAATNKARDAGKKLHEEFFVKHSEADYDTAIQKVIDAWTERDKVQAEIDAERLILENQMATELGVKVGARVLKRPANGVLTPMEVAKMYGDSLPTSLCKDIMGDDMVIMPKDKFVGKHMATARSLSTQLGTPGDELLASEYGITEQALGDIYDQLLIDLGITPSDGAEVMTFAHDAMFKQIGDEVDRQLRVRALPPEAEQELLEYIEMAASRLEGLGYSQEEWLAKRQAGLDMALKDYERDFPNYTNQNMFDSVMKSMYPFWVYEAQRMPYMMKHFIRRPGALAIWGKYMDYSDQGYISIPDSDLQFNPLRGTMFMGGFKRLMTKDYPEYYDMFPEAAEGIGALERAGFYAGMPMAAFRAVVGAKQGDVQTGELLTPGMNTFMGVLYNAPLPQDLKQRITQEILPDRFRDYRVMQVMMENGHDGMDIYNKVVNNIKLTPEEQSAWSEAANHVMNVTAVLDSQVGIFRIKGPNRIAYNQALKESMELLTGIPMDEYERIQRMSVVTGKRFSDLYKMDPLQQWLLREYLDKYSNFQGSATAPLMPSAMANMQLRIQSYYDEVEKIRKEGRELGIAVLDKDGNDTGQRTDSLRSLDEQFKQGLLSPSDYLQRVGDVMQNMSARADAISGQDYYKDVPKTRAQREKFYKENNIPVPTWSAGQELLWEYYNIKPELRIDENGVQSYDFDLYNAQTQAIFDAMDYETRQRFMARIQAEWTDTQRLYWKTSRDYLAAYRNARTLTKQEYSPEEQKLIDRFNRADLAEKTRIRNAETAEGKSLIGDYDAKTSQVRENLRILDPKMDAWLMFWGKVQKPVTNEAIVEYNKLLDTYRPGAEHLELIPE